MTTLAEPKMTHTLSTPELRRRIEAEMPSLTAIRHDLHRHPEMAFKEERTSAVVQRELDAAGVRFKSGLGGGTGVLGYLPASDPANESLPAVALRADMDALPIVEATGLAYASCNEGVMHACGHDGHTTMLIGAAKILSRMHRPRPVAFVFQPAEEGGGGGAIMCREGVLAGEGKGGIGSPVGEIFGLHGWPQLEVGSAASRPGPLLASVDDFLVTVKGVQAHGAYPHLSADPIVAMAHCITGIQTITSRNTSPLESMVVSVGMVQSGTADNIIPQTARFIGTVRTLTPALRKLAKERFFAIVENTCRAFGCEAAIEWIESYPVTVNDGPLTEEFFKVAREAFGKERILLADNPTMGGEDFSYYGAHAKACFFMLGLCPPGAANYPSLHQPDFNFNDAAMPMGIELFVRLATRAQ